MPECVDWLPAITWGAFAFAGCCACLALALGATDK
jgi:hypothetical protein